MANQVSSSPTRLTAGDLDHKQWLRTKDQQWLDNRIKVAQSVLSMSDGVTLRTDFDAQILLCCALGAIAAQVWPGEGIDKRRYIQLLVDYGTLNPSPKTISIPALMRAFEGTPERAQIESHFWRVPLHQVVAAHQIDVPEAAILSKMPTLPLKKIREASYASIIYRDLRCGLVHAYALQERLTDWSVVPREELTYLHHNQAPTLYMPYDYVQSVVRATAEAVFDEWVGSSDFNRQRPQPSAWWINP